MKQKLFNRSAQYIFWTIICDSFLQGKLGGALARKHLPGSELVEAFYFCLG